MRALLEMSGCTVCVTVSLLLAEQNAASVFSNGFRLAVYAEPGGLSA
jgi:hypothetical protein